MPNSFITIGGKERPVNFGRNFWAEVELLSNKSTSELLDVKELTSIRNQIFIAFAALKWGLYNPVKGTDPEIDFTKNHVGDWIDKNPDVMGEFYKHLTSALPTNKKKEGSEEA